MNTKKVLAHGLIVTAFTATAAASAPQAAAKAAGPRIAFERDGWVCVAALDGRGTTKVTEGVDPCLAPDGASFYCQDLDEIAHLSLAGKKLWSAPIVRLFAGAGLNSGARLSPSPDGAALLVDADMDEDTTVKEWDGPPPSVFRIDLASGKATRVTTKGVLVWEPQWLDASSFLATTIGPNNRQPSIVRVPFAGGPPVVVVKDAGTASVAASAW